MTNTNLQTIRQQQLSLLYREYYRTEEYKDNKNYQNLELLKYNNYNVIEAGKIFGISYCYDNMIGVPKKFLGKYNSKQFDIVGSEYSLDIGRDGY